MYLVFFQDMVSLHNLGYPRIHSIDQAGPELIEILLPLPPKCWD